MKCLIIIFILITIISCKATSFDRISKAIHLVCFDNTNYSGNSGKTSHMIRMRLYNEGKLNFLTHSDTFFTLEEIDIQSGISYGRIWAKNEVVNFEFSQGKFIFHEKDLFISHAIQLVERWDTIGIRQEELDNSKIFGGNVINASRVIKNSKVPIINCIKFKEFFLLERDQK